MKTIGIIGGLGPEATVDYYKEIIKNFNNNGNGSLNYPEIVVYSVNMSKFIGYLEKDMFVEATRYIATCINNLQKAGANFAVMSANTPHLLFEEIQDNVVLPLISIVEACAQRAKQLGLKRCGLFGTRFTMNADFYKQTFKKYDIDVISPDEKEIDVIHDKLFSELEVGVFKEETKILLLEIVLGMINKHQIDSLILGCTEFPLMFTNEIYLGIPFLNTTKIHVEQIVKACLSSL